MSVGQSECPEEVKNCPKKSVPTIEHDERLKNFNRILKIEIVVRNDV